MIKQTGQMKSRSYWTDNYDIAEYMAGEAAEETGGASVVIQCPIESFVDVFIKPDIPMFQEPLTFALEYADVDDAEELWDMWEKTDQTGLDSLEIIGSMVYDAPIPAKGLRLAF